MNNETFVQRHPVAVYFSLAFLISWVGVFLVAGPKFLRGEPIGLNEILLMGLPMLAGPITSGIVMSYLVDGRQGMRDLFGRMTNWRVGGRWYATLLIFPGVYIAVLLVLASLVSPEFTPNFLPILILPGLFAGLIEEIGWMGFVFPKMELKYGILKTSIYLGFLHGVWHMLLDFLGNSATFGGYWLPYFIGYVLVMMAVRVLIVWVYANTRSLLLSQLMHGSQSGFGAVLLPMSVYAAGGNSAVFHGVYAAVLWATAMVVIVKYGKSFVK